MAEYIRLVSYLNMYRNGEKKQNCGFAKIDSKNGLCRVQISVRMPFIRERSRCPVNFFVRENGKMYGVQVGEMTLENGRGFFGINTISTDMAHKGVGISQMSGIYIVTEYEGIVIASEWDDIAIEPDKFCDISEMNEYIEAAEYEEDPPENILKDASEEELKNGKNGGKETIQEPQAESGPVNRQNFETDQKKIDRIDCMRRIWDNLGCRCVKIDKVAGFDDCIKMKPNDIVCLPKRYWALGQNSFLLHGYYTHRYLIAAKMVENGNEKYIIGIPGEYHGNEKMMAAMFGFGTFAGEEEEGKKGYWCMELE